MAKEKLMFDGVSEECLHVETDAEHIFYTKDKRFIKFPKPLPKGKSLAGLIKEHNDANKVKPLPPSAEPTNPHQNPELKAWFGEK